MSGPESQKPDDLLLEEFLAGQGAVRAAYRDAAQTRAPAHLDAAILQAAQAVASRVPRAARRRWQAPVAAAAVMVLSLGVFLQVQRDPVVQQEVMAPLGRAAALPLAAGPAPAADKAEVSTEAPLPAARAEPKPAAPTAKRRVAPVQPLPPPPAPVSADTAAFDAAPAPEIAAPAAAMASESIPREEQFAARAAPMAKASRAPLAARLMSQRDAQSAVASEAGIAPTIERWAQHCEAEPVVLSAPLHWRGLAVTAWSRQASDGHEKTKLLFAPEVTQEAIAAALGALAVKTTLTTAMCSGPVTRDLQHADAGWFLACECQAEN